MTTTVPPDEPANLCEIRDQDGNLLSAIREDGAVYSVKTGWIPADSGHLPSTVFKVK
jgi:hypothetical protein